MNEAKKLSSARLLWAKENAEQSKSKILAGKQHITLHQAQRLKKDSKKLDYVDNDVEKSLEMLCRAPEGDPIIKKWIKAPETVIFLSHNENIKSGLKIAEEYVMSCDAMGKIVNNYKGQEILYYELVCRNPVPKKPIFPIAGLLSTGQSEDEINKFVYTKAQSRVIGQEQLCPKIMKKMKFLTFLTFLKI